MFKACKSGVLLGKKVSVTGELSLAQAPEIDIPTSLLFVRTLHTMAVTSARELTWTSFLTWYMRMGWLLWASLGHNMSVLTNMSLVVISCIEKLPTLLCNIVMPSRGNSGGHKINLYHATFAFRNKDPKNTCLRVMIYQTVNTKAVQGNVKAQ